MDYLNILPPLFYAMIDFIDLCNDIYQEKLFRKWKNNTNRINRNESRDIVGIEGSE